MTVIAVAAFMAIYLAVGGHSASVAQYSISNDKLNVNIPIEDLWDSLSKSKKKLIIMIFPIIMF